MPAAEILHGHHAILEALRAGRRRVYRLYIAPGIKEQGDVAEILRLARAKRVPIEYTSRTDLIQSDSETRQQNIVAQVSPYPYDDWEKIVEDASGSGERPLLLLLDCLQDPQNLGTLLRTAEAVGVHGVAIPEHRAVGITPAVSNASAGAVEHLRIAQVGNMAQTIELLKSKGIWVVGLEQTPTSKRYDQVDLDMPLALVVGSEGKGLRRLTRERCDLLIYLPMQGKINSLNAAVAGSIALYWAWRQRSPKSALG